MKKKKCVCPESYLRLTFTLANNFHLNTRLRQLFSLYRLHLNYSDPSLSRNRFLKSHTVLTVNVPSMQTQTAFFLVLTTPNKDHEKCQVICS